MSKGNIIDTTLKGLYMEEAEFLNNIGLCYILDINFIET